MENTILTIAISSIDFLNFFEKIKLLKALKTLEASGLADAIAFLKDKSFGQIVNLAQRDINRPLRIQRWDGEEHLRLAKKSAIEAKALGVESVTCLDPLYPPLLKEITDPPFALFYRGNIKVLFSKCVSVVGTRRLSPEGKKASYEFSYEASSAGYCVVSGLAMGADGAAHKGSIDAFYDGKSSLCKTAAILAGGVDNIFPPIHKNMAGTIIQKGGVVLSECPPGVPGEKWRFISRNRIIAGLSPATLVVQAPPGSGALLTADFALDYNRDLFFHEACFCKNALTLSNMIHKKLEAQKGVAAARKIQSRPETFVSDGARVIKSFSDFVFEMS